MKVDMLLSQVEFHLDANFCNSVIVKKKKASTPLVESAHNINLIVNIYAFLKKIWDF